MVDYKEPSDTDWCKGERVETKYDSNGTVSEERLYRDNKCYSIKRYYKAGELFSETKGLHGAGGLLITGTRIKYYLNGNIKKEVGVKKERTEYIRVYAEDGKLRYEDIM